MDEDILRTVEKISGKLSRDCYYDLCCLVKAAIPVCRAPSPWRRCIRRRRDTVKRKRTPWQRPSPGRRRTSGTAETGRSCRSSFNACCGKSPRRRIWSGCWPCRSGAGARRCGRRCAIRFWRPGTPRRFGFSGESWEPERHLVVLLPGREQAEVEQLVRRLNQRQIPIQEAEERFLNGEDLLPVL